MIAQLSREYILTKPSKVYSRLLSYLYYEGRPATTSGRWFNHFTFSSLRRAAISKINPEAESPVFITGTGRSGSTILGMVLSMHPQIGFLNEPKALWQYVNPADDLIGSYSISPANYIMNGSDGSAEISQKAKAIYSSFLKKSSNHRIVDKYPEMIFRLEYLNSIFKDPKYIFLVRNPWDTISSTAEWSAQHVNVLRNENWWGINNRKWKLLVEQVIVNDVSLSRDKKMIADLTNQIDMAAVEWIATMNYGLKMMDKNSDKIFLVKYEDICTHPLTTLEQIFKFIDLPADQSCIRYGEKVLKTLPVKAKPTLHPLLEEIIRPLGEKFGYRA